MPPRVPDGSVPPREADTDAETVRIEDGRVAALLGDLEETQDERSRLRAAASARAPRSAPRPPPQTRVTIAEPSPLTWREELPLELDEDEPELAEPRRGNSWVVPILSALAGMAVGSAALLLLLAALVLRGNPS